MKRNSKRSLHSGSALLMGIAALNPSYVLSVSFLFACHAAGAADPLPRSAPATAGFSAAALERIDRFYADEIAKDRIPGAVVAIAREGKLVYYKALGYQDKNAGTLLKTDAIFNLASMTKVLTVVSALTLYEEGRLPLKSTLATYYPQFSSVQVGVVDSSGAIRLEPAKQPIFVQDLMRHTTGLTYGARGNSPVHKLYPASSATAAYSMTGPEFIDALAKLPLLYQPGTTWDYGFSVDVLGLVVEKITGKTLGAASEERVWSKLGMRDTAFSVPAGKTQPAGSPVAERPDHG